MSKVKWVRLWDYIEQSDSKNSQSLYGIVSFPEFGGSSSIQLKCVKLKENPENPSAQVETSSLMLCLRPFPCVQAPR